MSELRVEGLRAAPGGIEVVHGVDLTVGDGAVVALLGPNGSGKSSLLRALMGLVPASGGVWLDGVPLERLPVRDRVARGLVLCLDTRGLFGDMTLEENLLTGAYLRLDRLGVAADLAAVRSSVERLVERWRTRAGLLSGGEQRILGIAKALMARPKCLLVDEPTAGLGPGFRAPLATLLRKGISPARPSVLLAEQSLEFVLDLGADVITMRDGRLVERFSASEVRASLEVRERVESLV